MKHLMCIAVALGVGACGPGADDKGCKDKILAGDLVITEVFADYAAPEGSTGADTGKEWFEVYNASDHPIEMQGVTLTHSRPDGSKAQTHTMTEIVVAPGQFLVLGDAATDLVPAYVDYGYGADLGEFFNTDGGKLALSCGSDAVDSAEYDTIKSGHSRELTSAQPPDYTLNDDLASWCQGDATEFDHGNFGTPGQESDCQPLIVGQCTDHGTSRPVVSPAPGDLVITEVMPDPAKTSDTVGEWFEALAVHDVDLNGLGLDRAGDSAKPDLIGGTDCVHATAGQYLVFGKNTDPAMNGGLPGLSGTFKFAMVSPGDVQIVLGATVIDAVSWMSSRSGKSLQLDPEAEDPQANDDPSNFCDGTTPYGAGSGSGSGSATGDLGTPGLANLQCASTPQPGTCNDGGTSRPIVKPATGALVITEILPNPAGDETKQEWVEITNTGSAAFDLNELALDRPDDTRMPDVVQSADCKSVAPGAFALFARSTDMTANGGLATVDATFGFSLVNSNGTVQVLDGTTPLDVVTWGTAANGVSLQLDPDLTTTTANDTKTNFCAGTTLYGDNTNKGTPRAANAQCPGL